MRFLNIFGESSRVCGAVRRLLLPLLRHQASTAAAAHSLSTEDGDGVAASVPWTAECGGGSLSAEDSGAAASTLAEAGIAVSTARHDSSLLLLARRTVSNFKP